MFKPAYECSDAVWNSDAAVADARVRWWYRKWYQETGAGQLTTFRDDAPLYHFLPDWKQQALIADWARQTAQSAVTIQKLLVFVLVVLALILFLLWERA